MRLRTASAANWFVEATLHKPKSVQEVFETAEYALLLLLLPSFTLGLSLEALLLLIVQLVDVPARPFLLQLVGHHHYLLHVAVKLQVL